jgi:hypothetical protein
MNASVWELSVIGDGNQSEKYGNKQADIIQVNQNTFLFHATSIGLGPTAQFFESSLIPSRKSTRINRRSFWSRTVP